MQTRRIVLGSLTALASLACSALDSSPPRKATTQALAGGSIDPDTTAVFALEVSAPERTLCSAVLVAPNLLLTARHCLAGAADSEVVCGESPLDTLVEPEAVVLDNVLSYLDTPQPGLQVPAIARFEVPPGAADVCGNDLAALLLDRAILTPPLVPRLADPATVGERYTAVGYGRSTLSEGSRAGVRMRLEDQVVRCVGSACAIPSAATEFGGDDGVCLGDSGGPAVDRQGRVLGIASRSAEGCETPVYTSLPAFAAWLEPLLDEAAELGGYERPALEPPELPEPPEESSSGAATTSSTEASAAKLGESCDAELVCAAPLACVTETTPDEARCRERCREDSDCPGGQACDPEALVCWAPPDAGAADCSFGRAPPGSGSKLIALVGMAGWRRRRARRRAHP